MIRQKKDVLCPLVIHSGCSCGISSLNQTAGQASFEAASDQRFISARVKHVQDEAWGGMSGQVGSDLGLITQLPILHKNPETNQHRIPDPALEFIHLPPLLAPQT